jgi:hypothetical protein
MQGVLGQTGKCDMDARLWGETAELSQQTSAVHHVIITTIGPLEQILVASTGGERGNAWLTPAGLARHRMTISWGIGLRHSR